MHMAQEIFVLNPDYCFKKDIDRILIYSKRRIRFNASEDWRSSLHPYHAQILAFFTSPEPFERKISALASHFNQPAETISQLLEPYRNNPDIFFTEWNGSIVRFPRRILIPLEEVGEINDNTYSFTAEDLNVSGEIDLDTRRIKKGPHGILWMWTNRCGTRCLYCYADTFTKNKELSTRRMLELFEEAKQLKVEHTDIIGGEIMLRPDWDQLLTWLVENDMPPGFISTKLPVTPLIADKLKASGFKGLFQVSLDSLDDKSLSTLVGAKPGYARRMKEGLEMLKEIPVRVQVNTVLTSLNIDKRQINDMFTYLNDRGDLEKWELRVPDVSIYTTDTFMRNRAKRKQLEELRAYVSEELTPKSSIPIFFNDDALNYKYRCTSPEEPCFKEGACGYLSERIFVLPDGKVSTCEQLYWQPQFIIGDLSHQSIEEVWNSEAARKLYEADSSLYRDSSPCRQCKAFEECNKAKRRCVVKVLKAYGQDKWDYPDPRCILAPEFKSELEY